MVHGGPCLDDALRLQQYINEAEQDGDDELAELFRRAQADGRKVALRLALGRRSGRRLPEQAGDLGSCLVRFGGNFGHSGDDEVEGAATRGRQRS